jgi:Uma2 family endonuclease
MSTTQRRSSKRLPPLADGEPLDQPTFHARYEAMPPETRAELIDGVVRMPSPMRNDHGDTTSDVSGWVFHYKRFTKGIKGGDNTTTILGQFTEPQPDCILYIPESLGGLSRINAAGYLVGPPELVVEVARSSRQYDLGDKKKDYQRAGVPEYVVVTLAPNQIYWFLLRRGRYVKNPPGADGIIRSTIFPGLWLDPKALFAGDLDGLIAALEQGLATPEHAAFAGRMAQVRRAH